MLREKLDGYVARSVFFFLPVLTKSSGDTNGSTDVVVLDKRGMLDSAQALLAASGCRSRGFTL